VFRPRPAVLGLVVLVAAMLGSGAPAQAQSPTPCPATFHVLHDDVIGDLQLPAGQYQLAVDGVHVTCAQASHLFTQFLQDFDGVLPRAWSYDAVAVGEGVFTGRGTFAVVRTGDAGGSGTTGTATTGGGSHGDLVCPGTFEVVHNDRVGRLRIPAGDYMITLLGGNLTCPTAERFFAAFLKRPRGNLPRRWVVLPRSAEFMRYSSHHGFRIKPAA
jgi:hypothetical protein